MGRDGGRATRPARRPEEPSAPEQERGLYRHAAVGLPTSPKHVRTLSRRFRPAQGPGGPALCRRQAMRQPSNAKREPWQGVPINTLFITVVLLTRLKVWKIIPMRERRARNSCLPAPTTSWPSTLTEPAVMGTKPLMARRQGRLAGARQADDDEQLSRRNGKRNVVECLQSTGICDVDVLEFDHSFIRGCLRGSPLKGDPRETDFRFYWFRASYALAMATSESTVAWSARMRSVHE